MEAKIVLDISAVVWDEQDFNTNQTLYYSLASEFYIFLQAFEKCNHLQFIARTELKDSIMEQFPYFVSNSPQLSTFKNMVLRFLSKHKPISYPISNSSTINSIPDICHNYFTDTLKLEIKYLLSEMHSAENYIFCTFSSCWDTTDKLKTKNSTTKEHNTVVHGNGNQTIQDFYNTTFRNIFEHNSKHDRIKGKRVENGETVSPLSCFDGSNTDIPQSLLDNAIKFNDEFYNYDTINQIFVCFKKHQDNKYHGYDEDINNVPPQIKNIFHK